MVSLSERILLIISVAVLYAIFIFIITEVALIISEIGYRNKKYRQTMREVNLMMREHNFPGDLRYRLRRYIRFRHVQQDGNSAGMSLNASPERRYILSLLSPQLRQEAMVHMNNAGIGQVKLFQDAELPNDALLALSVGARIEVYAGHEFVYKAGDPAVSLNVVVKGVISNKGRLVRRRDTFGEEACLSAHTEYISSAYTITFCSICHLDGKSIKRMFKKYSLSEIKMRKQLALCSHRSLPTPVDLEFTRPAKARSFAGCARTSATLEVACRRREEGKAGGIQERLLQPRIFRVNVFPHVPDLQQVCRRVRGDGAVRAANSASVACEGASPKD